MDSQAQIQDPTSSLDHNGHGTEEVMTCVTALKPQTAFTDTMVSPGGGCNQRKSMVMISVMDIWDFVPCARQT
jgi:hypothetical protein